MKAYQIPLSSRTARGTAIINLLQLMPGEKITAVIPIRGYDTDDNLFMTTRSGIVKKTPIRDYANIRKSGLIAINIREDDELIEVKLTDKTKDILLITKMGQCIRFHEEDVRATGRNTMGVIGMKLMPGDEVVAMQMNTQGDSILLVSEYGMGKRTRIDEFSPQFRGGKGIKCYKITEKTGNLVGAKAVNDENEIMLITTEGIIIQMMVNEISTLGRVASGVKLMDLDPTKDVVIASMAKVRKPIEETTEENEESVQETEDETEE